MKSMKGLSCVLAVLMTALCVHAETITYDFDDGTLQGWVNDVKAGREFVCWDTAADDNGGQFIAYSGDFAMRIDEFGVRDGTTDLLLITSPEFKISTETTIDIWALGGMGPIAEPTWTNYADVPTTATSSGFMGAALRRVSDGEYVLFGRRDRNTESDDSPSWTPIEWSAADIAAAIASDNPSERYVIDIIDAYTGSWGWFGFDDVVLTNVAFVGEAVAFEPSPDDGAEDVEPATTLQWQAGAYAETHDVYLGTDFDDVNDATIDSDLYLGRLSDTAYVPTDLELGMTYYWRIDEVNGAPDLTVYKGETWSFTTEPFAYVVADVVATTNTEYEADQGPEKLVDGSGLNADDEHSTESTAMWIGDAVDGEQPYIQFEFDRVYRLHEMLIWNHNTEFELLLGFGVKNVTVEYSETGTEWTVLDDVQLAQATAKADYAANTMIEFNGVAARYVRLLINSGYGPMSRYGLSEVRFTYIPVAARKPEPADGATDVSVSTVLDWRPGRGTVSHEVYLSTDEAAVLDGTALADVTDDSQYLPADLQLDTAYYWKVTEVNEADATAAREGKVWSFATEAFRVVDDFESYTDDEGSRIYEFWEDGFVNGTGSTAGYFEAPFAEKEIVQSGRQSMPLFYEGTSEVDLTLAGQDWTAHGVQSLGLYFYGDAESTGGQLYVKINGTRVDCDDSVVNLLEPSWQLWTIDLATVGNVSQVETLTIGIEGAGASGVVYVDDIRLY